MHRLLLQSLAFFLVPAALVFAGEAVARHPWVYSVLHQLPYLEDLPTFAFQYGLTPADPAPLVAAAIGIGGFMVSTNAYREALWMSPTPGREMPLYLRLVLLRIGLIVGGAFLVFLFTQRYLRLPMTLSTVCALGTGYILFRQITSGPGHPPLAQGSGAITAEEAEALRHGAHGGDNGGSGAGAGG